MPYANPAIADLIVCLIFSPTHSKKPLALTSLEWFNPIPTPLIAYACTGVGFLDVSFFAYLIANERCATLLRSIRAANANS